MKSRNVYGEVYPTAIHQFVRRTEDQVDPRITLTDDQRNSLEQIRSEVDLILTQIERGIVNFPPPELSDGDESHA